VTHLPVIKIEKLETNKINLENYKAVIFTSSNAIRFMNIEKFDLIIKCFCVGSATEFTARQTGFINTYSSGGTVDSLIELIIRTLDIKSGKLLYLSSEFISKDLDSDLIRAGYSVDRISNYTSLPIEQIDEKTLNSFKKNSKSSTCSITWLAITKSNSLSLKGNLFSLILINLFLLILKANF